MCECGDEDADQGRARRGACGTREAKLRLWTLTWVVFHAIVARWTPVTWASVSMVSRDTEL